MSEPARYKGKWIKKSVLTKKLKAAEKMAERRQKMKSMPATQEQVKYVCEGSRIIDVQELVKNLFCSDCNGVLHLKDIVGEKRLGLHSVWNIRCDFCEEVTEVATGKTHMAQDCFKNFANVNTKSVLGAMESGMGYTGLNKVLTCLDIPGIPLNIYKQHEKEVGPGVAAVAVDSCKCKCGASEEPQVFSEEDMDQLYQKPLEETDPLAIPPRRPGRPRKS